MKDKIANWIFDNLSGDNSRHCVPPGAECQLNFGAEDAPQIATTYNNDGFELWLGTPHRWHVFYSAKAARRLAWFILWDWWIVSTWYGLKRRIWYWALHHDVQSWRNESPESTAPGRSE